MGMQTKKDICVQKRVNRLKAWVSSGICGIYRSSSETCEVLALSDRSGIDRSRFYFFCASTVYELGSEFRCLLENLVRRVLCCFDTELSFWNTFGSSFFHAVVPLFFKL